MKKTYRSISAIKPPPPFHMVGNGFRVHNFFPSDPEIGIYGMSPFFLLDYGSKHYFPPSELPRGVGVHPHRGIETVTIAFHGAVAHNDSAGNSGVIYEGDVQWMTAASGVLHKEYHEKEFNRRGGDFQMVQIWVNLPARYKMTEPKYQAIEKKQITRHFLDDGKSNIGIIAGEYLGLKGPASTFTPLNLYVSELEKQAQAEFSFTKTSNCGVLVIEGELLINGTQTLPLDHFALLGHDAESISMKASENSIVVVLSGEPIDEPLVPHGPFLMNTEAEIRQAYDDYRKAKFGYLED